MAGTILRNSLYASLSLAALAAATPARALDGIELSGYGARQKALGAADIADSKDAMSMSINPAGIVGLPREYQFGISAIFPERGYNASGPLTVWAPGDVRSGRGIFPVPNSASVSPIDADSAWGQVSYGNGGINSAYSFYNFKPPIFAPSFGPIAGPLIAPSFGGPLGGGFAGFDLQQQFFSVVYARKFGPVTIGFAPTLVGQMLNVQGLKSLAYLSRDPYHLSDNGYDFSFGGGFRVGLQYEITPGLRFGAAGSTPMFMTPFDKYAGIIGDHGKLDVPADVSAGFAYDLAPNLTVMVDWKHIFYSAVPSMGNSSFPLFPGSLGAFNGPGLGWRDTDSEAFGVEWRALSRLTLRAGYHHSSVMIPSNQVSFNSITPAVARHDVSGGFNFELTKNSSVDLAAIYAFKSSVSGQEAVPFVAFTYPVTPIGPIGVVLPPHYGPGTSSTIWGRGLEIAVSYSYKFDAGDNSWIPSHF